MAISGGFLLMIGALGLWFSKKKQKIMEMKWLLSIIAFCTFVPFIANTAGWLITELGRYPWTVYGLFTIEDSVSPNVSVASLVTSNSIYFVLFTALGAVMVYLVYKEMQKGPYHVSELEKGESEEQDTYEKGAL